MSVLSLPGFRVVGGALLLATVVAGVLEWRGSSAPQPGGAPDAVAGRASAAAVPGANGTGGPGVLTPGAGAAAQPGLDPAVADARPAEVVPVNPAIAFTAAVKAAREAPQPPPPAGVAQARTFPEAFEAMRQAQREPPSALAGVSPFGGAPTR